MKHLIADKTRRRAVRAEIDRQNLARIGVLAPIVIVLMLLFLLRERSYLDLSAAELGALFRVPAIEPALFEQVVAYRIATLLAVLLSASLAWYWRGKPRLLGPCVAAFVLLVGGMLVATASLNLAFRDAFDLLYLTLFIFSALFFLRPWLAVMFFGGASLIYVAGAAELMLNPTPTRLQALYTNVTIMAGLAMAIAIQNYRIKFRELAALDAARRDNETLQQANRAITLSSETDGLTALFNRRALDRDLEQLQQKRISYVLAMLDIDYFKAFNDHYGHQAGDRALQSVAFCLKTGLNRASDRVYRYGGEEFAILLRDTDLRGGWTVLEALRERVEALGIEHAYRGDGNTVVTLSAGIAEALDETAAAVLERADRSLYESKAAGRNRVTPAP